jgi:hypothetical protein
MNATLLWVAVFFILTFVSRVRARGAALHTCVLLRVLLCGDTCAYIYVDGTCALGQIEYIAEVTGL